MSKTLRVPIDGLSRCLCPLIDSVQRTSARRLPILLGSRRRPCIESQAPSRHHRRSSTAAFLRPRSKPGYRVEWDIKDVPINEAYDALLSATGAEHDAYEKTTSMLHVILGRGERPNLLQYDALISVNADAADGSAAVVEGLLAEMKEQRIMPDAGTYEKVLQVLAMHPDYVLRAEVLEEMKARWIYLSPNGYEFLILGQLRDHQFEMAVMTLQHAESESVPILSHVYDVILYVLTNAAELDTALTILQSRVATLGDTGVSTNIWFYMLERCASAMHHAGIQYIWRKRVQPGYINPHDGICASVLNTAARHSNVALATDVVRILANRKVRIDFHHYEALIETYLGAGDLNHAFRVLCIMKKARLEPDNSSTREITIYLREHPRAVNDSWGVLTSLREEIYEIPTAAVNAVLEAYCHIQQFPKAMEMYKKLHEICVDGPNVATFNLLLRGCRRQSASDKAKKSIAMFLAAEMRALNVEASEVTYDRLIIICLRCAETAAKEADDKQRQEQNESAEWKEEGREAEPPYEDAFRYYEEMKMVGGNRGWHPRPNTYKLMLAACQDREPERARLLLREMEALGMSLPFRKLKKRDDHDQIHHEQGGEARWYSLEGLRSGGSS